MPTMSFVQVFFTKSLTIASYNTKMQVNLYTFKLNFRQTTEYKTFQVTCLLLNPKSKYLQPNF